MVNENCRIRVEPYKQARDGEVVRSRLFEVEGVPYVATLQVYNVESRNKGRNDISDEVFDSAKSLAATMIEEGLLVGEKPFTISVKTED